MSLGLELAISFISYLWSIVRALLHQTPNN